MLKNEQMPQAIVDIKETQQKILSLLQLKPKIQSKEKLTIEEAIIYLNHKHGIKLAKQTIYNLIQDNKIPYLKYKGAKRLIFSIIDLDNWAKNNLSINSSNS